MIFFIDHIQAADSLIFPQNLDLFCFRIGKESKSSLNSYSIISHEKILFCLKASLKEGQNVLVLNGQTLPKFDHDLLKQRLKVEKDQFIFMSPRASFFFKQGIDRIDIKNYSELEQLCLSWGK